MGKVSDISKPASATLVISRMLDAPPQEVFGAWTQPDRLRQWLSPKAFTCPFCEIDLRPGGTVRVCMRSVEGKDYWSRGEYLEIVEPERLVYTDSFADADGNTVSPQTYGMGAEWPVEALVTVTFANEEGRTRLTLEHSPLPAGEQRDMCRQGWNECLDKLAAYLAAPQTEAER